MLFMTIVGPRKAKTYSQHAVCCVSRDLQYARIRVPFITCLVASGAFFPELALACFRLSVLNFCQNLSSKNSAASSDDQWIELRVAARKMLNSIVLFVFFPES